MVIVEDAGFIAFVEFITVHLGGVSLTIPKREKLRQDIIALAEEYRRRVRKCIASGCLYYSITCDIWTARTAKSYISLTIHYVDEEFTPKNWTLEVRLFPGIHDGTTISAMITRILEEWSMPKRFCVKLLRDSGANMVAASKKLNIEHMACIAHSLHLVVAGALIKKSKTASGNVIPEWAEDVAAESSTNVAEREEEATLSKEDRAEIEGLQELAIDEMEEFLDSTIAGLHRNEMDSLRTIVQNFRTLAVYFRKSSKGNNRLGAIQIQHFNIKPENVLSPIVDCPTRWNSCWKMLDQLIALEAPLMKFFAHLKQPEGRKEFKDMEKKLRRPKPEEWFSIKCLQKLLGPFATASDTLGGQTYPTTPLILPVLSGIRKHLERVDLFDVLAAEAGDEEFVFDTTFMMNECRKAMLTLLTSVLEPWRRASSSGSLSWIHGWRSECLI
ncbi:hypothetical protein PF003_g23835 [Phytophthora fragariae]|nr:hypothetical protein PF003_g23835 [Phytophthora fragariae]